MNNKNDDKDEYTEEELLMIEYYSDSKVQKRLLEFSRIEDIGSEIPR